MLSEGTGNQKVFSGISQSSTSQKQLESLSLESLSLQETTVKKGKKDKALTKFREIRYEYFQPIAVPS